MTPRTARLSASATDLELVAAAQAGDSVAFDRLVDRYRRFVRSRSRGYFIVGGDREDLEQEALIGFYKSVRDFKPELQASFRAFAELCITRQVITAIKTATRQKHQPLNQYVSLSGVRGSDDRRRPVRCRPNMGKPRVAKSGRTPRSRPSPSSHARQTGLVPFSRDST